VTHLVRTPDEPYAAARTYVDDEYGVPIRYEGYTWPEKPDGERVLVEEYTYSSVQLNVGLTDQDFDPDNSQYNFK
jgi:outer membrane lipoprotein-sorting protein